MSIHMVGITGLYMWVSEPVGVGPLRFTSIMLMMPQSHELLRLFYESAVRVSGVHYQY